MNQLALRTENITTTIRQLDNDFAGRREDPTHNPSMLMHIHRRNRPFVWNRDMQSLFLKSILKDYPIPQIYCSSTIVNGENRREIMDGGNRITTFRKILRNEVRKLTEEERVIVQSKSINLVVMSNLTAKEQREFFRVINKHVPVTDGQLYAMSEDDSPLVREAYAFLGTPPYNNDHPLRQNIITYLFDTQKTDNERKRNLATAVALVSGCLYGPDYITSKFSRQEQTRPSVVPGSMPLPSPVECQDELDRDIVVTKMGLVLEVFRLADEECMCTVKQRNAQWALGYIGAILYDICASPTAIRSVQEKWVKYVVKLRRGEPNAEEARKLKGAQNLNRERLRKISKSVEIYVNENRLVKEDELKTLVGMHPQEEDTDDDDTVSDDDM